MNDPSRNGAEKRRLVLWLAPWFGGLDARYLAILREHLDVDTKLIATDAGLVRAPDAHTESCLSAGLKGWISWLHFLAVVAKRMWTRDIALLDDTWDPRFIALWIMGGKHRFLVVHDAVPHDADNEQRHEWQRLLKSLCRRRSQNVICFSHAVRERVMNSPDFRRVRNVTVVSLLPEIERRPLERSPLGRPYFLVPGRFSPYKNVSMVLDAWDLMDPKARATCGLRFAGKGSRAQVMNHPLADEVEVVDRALSEDEFAAQVAGAQGVLVCYSAASQSGVACAALAEGVPVVTTRVGGLTEYQPSPDLIVESPQQLADALTRLTRDPEQYRGAARDFASKRFSPAEVAREWAAVLTP